MTAVCGPIFIRAFVWAVDAKIHRKSPAVSQHTDKTRLGKISQSVVAVFAQLGGFTANVHQVNAIKDQDSSHATTFGAMKLLHILYAVVLLQKYAQISSAIPDC